MVKKTFILNGTLKNTSGKMLSGFRIEAWDKDMIANDFVGEAVSDRNGKFKLTFDQNRFKELFLDSRPDIYFKIYSEGKLIHSTENSLLWNIDTGQKDLEVVVPLSTDISGSGSGSGNHETLTGSVVHSNGNAIPNLKIVLSEQQLRSKNPLKTTTTNASGSFSFAASVVDGKVVIIEAVDENGKVLASSEIIYPGAKMESYLLQVTNISYKGHADYVRYQLKLQSFLTQLQSDKNAKPLNIADVYFVSNSAGTEPRDTFRWLRANHMETKTKIPAEFFYGLYSLDQPTHPQALGAISGSELENAIKKAAESSIVSDSISAKVKDIVTQWNNHLAIQALAEVPAEMNSSLGDILSMASIDKGKQQKLLTDYLAHSGTLDEFWKGKGAEIGNDNAEKIQKLLKLSAFTGNQLSIVAALEKREYKADNIFQDLASMSQTDWVDLIKGASTNKGKAAVPTFIKGKNETERIEKYASQLTTNLEENFPTHSFFGKLAKQPAGQSSFEKTKGYLDTFFHNNPSFDLKTTNTLTITRENSSFSFNGIDDDGKIMLAKDLQSVQRLSAYTNSFKTLSLLKKDGLDSAYNMMTLTMNQFVADYSEHLGSVQGAQQMYKKAEKSYMQTAILWAKAHPNLSLKTTTTPAPISEPMLRTMFGTLDSCECEHCTSVFSPAAYFVDILNFLYKRSPDAYNELIRRRADLIHIDLTCSNTNTPLPYVDLVNELLENYVLKTNGLALPAPYQTTWKASELEANPQHISYSAYDKLKEAVYPQVLPFNLPVEEARIYLNHLGIERHRLMSVFFPGTATQAFSNFYLSLERLGFNKQEADILSAKTTGFGTGAESGLWNFYGFDKATGYKPLTDPADSSKHISGGNWNSKLTSRVDVFLQQTDLLYKEFLSLLLCSTINPVTGHDAAGKELRAITIRPLPGVPNDSCQLDQLCLVGVTTNHLQQIHCFLRLWRKLGWSIFDVDKACIALDIKFIKPTSPANANETDLVKLAQAKYISEQTNLSMESMLAFWSDINTTSYTDYFKDNYPPIPSLYEKLFINKAVINPVDAALSSPAALAGSLDSHSASIIAALQINAEDYAGLKTTLPDNNLTLPNLSSLYRQAVLAKKLKLNVDDFNSLKAILGISPFGSPADTFLFIEKSKTVTSSGFSIAQINYLLNHTFTADSGEAPTDESIGVFLSVLRVALRSLAADAGADAQKSIVAQKISEQLKISAATANMLVNIHIKGITDASKPVSNDFIIAANFLRTYTDNSDPANPVDFEPMFVRANPTADVSFDAEPDLFNDYMRLEKVAKLINKLKLSDSDVKTILLYHATINCTNLAELPINAAVGNFDKFENLVDLIKARDIMPLGTPDFMNILLAAIVSPGKNKWLEDLATRTTWNRATLEALVGNVTTLNSAGLLKVDFPANFTNGRLILTVKGCLDEIARSGLSTDVIKEVVKEDFDVVVSTAIKNTVKGKYDESQWNKLAKPLRNHLREKQRQTLVAYVVAHPNYDGVTDFERWKNADELYEHLLIDVEMKPISLTSRIKQAICSVQLFVDRVLLNMEHPNSNPATSPLKLDGAQVEEWNEWRKLYRVWEANRKIFLYPENWIEPELRDDKSPFFKELETQLKQNELTIDNVEDAFHSYLDKLDDVARLEVVGLYHQVEKDMADEADVDILHVFARTPIAPHHYYHRTLENGEWTSWFKMEIEVDGNHIVPVIFNRKLCLFWLFFTQGSDENFDISEPTPMYWKVQVAWSEFRKNKWTAKRLSKEILESKRFIHLDESQDYKTKLTLRHWIDQDGDELAESPFDGKLHLYMGLEESGWIDGQEIYGASYLFENTNTDPDLIEENQFNSFMLPRSTNEFEQMVKSTRTGDSLTIVEPEYFVTPGGGMAGRAKDINILNDSPNGRYKLVAPTNEELPYHKHFVFQDKTNTFFVQRATVRVHRYDKFPYSLGDWDMDFKETWLEHYNPVIDPDGPIINPVDTFVDPALDEHFGNDYKFKQPRATKPIAAKTMEMANATIMIHANTHNGSLNNGGSPARTAARPMIARLAKNRSQVSKTKVGTLLPSEIVFLNKYKEEDRYTFSTFYHGHVKTFKRALYKNGVQGLLKRDLETQPDTIGFKNAYAPTGLVATPYPGNNVSFEYGSPYSQYNWELFFHVPMLIACRLKDDQRFEEARSWFHFIFDPTQSEGGDKERFWQFKPFYDEAGTEIETLDDLLHNQIELKAQIDKWMKDPFKPHVIARMRISAYMRNVVMKYLDNLIAWADNLFKRDTIEAINEATNLYVLASKILGERPQQIPPRASHDDVTFDDIKDLLDDFSNAMVNIETMLAPSAASGGVVTPGSAGALGKMFYFCVPRNEYIMKYWDTIADRLFKIRNSMNMQGVVRTLPLFEPPIDPAMLVRAAAMGMDLSSILSDMNAPRPHYRFNFMLQRAMEFSNEVKGLGVALLQALEKRDAEAFALLRSTHEQKILSAQLVMKEKQVDDASTQLESVRKTKEITQLKYDYYSSRPFMNSHESQQLDSVQTGMLFSIIQGELNTIGGVLSAIPNLKVGVPTSMGATWGGDNLGAMMNAISTYMGIFAAINNAQGSMAATFGSYTRRMDDWQFQTDSAVKELQQLDKQILSAEIRLAIAEKDKENQQQQIDNNRDADDFMRSKFTNSELYNWMVGQLATVYFQSYQLAYDLAKRVEQCYQYELGEFGNSSFIQFGYWDSLKKGLLCAEKLQYDLRRMESAYYELNKRDLELTKHVSLLMLNPQAIVDLRRNGTNTFVIPEELYDLDFQGHYFRRIKSISISMPCIAGPYTAINATLRLLKHTTRISTSLSPSYQSADYSNDIRFRYVSSESQAIATSTAQNDRGVFELNFRDERYLPFEGCGAIGEWQLELTSEKELRMFDYNTISDVIITINYTAIEAVDNAVAFKSDVNAYLKNLIMNTVAPTSSVSGLMLHRMFSLRHEYTSEWHRLFNPIAGTTHAMNFKMQKEQFPYFAQDRIVVFVKLNVNGVFTTNDEYTVIIKSNNGADVSFILNSGNGYQAANTPALPASFGLGDFELKVQKTTGSLEAIDASITEVKDIIIVVNYNLQNLV